MSSCLKNRKWEGPHSTTYVYLFSQRKRKLFFLDGSSPHSSNSVANAPEKPSASAGTYLLPLYHWLAPSSWQHHPFPSFPLLWSSTSWEKPWDEERQEPSTFPLLFSNKRNQRLDSIRKEMRNGYSSGQRKHDQRKDNSHHHRKGWENFFGRHQYRRTRQMVGVVPPGSQNLLNLCTSPQTWKRRRSQQAINWVHCLREEVGLKLCGFFFYFKWRNLIKMIGISWGNSQPFHFFKSLCITKGVWSPWIFTL